MSARRRRAATAAWLAGLLGAAWGCAPGEPAGVDSEMRPLHRFALRGAGGAGVAVPATGTLFGETRPLLEAPRRVTLHSPAIEVDRAGVLRVEITLPGGFAGLRGAVAILVLSDGSRRHRLPAQLYTFVRRTEGLVFPLELALPAELAGARQVFLTLTGLGVPEAEVTRVETPPIAIPPGARLDFAIGILEPDFAGGPVAFELSACLRDACSALLTQTLDPAGAGGRGWQERRVPLAPFAGTSRRLRFETRRLAAAQSSALPAFANPTLFAPVPRGPDSPNVILLSIDTLRADHLTSYGYARDTAPFVQEAFAKGGTLFEHVVAASPVTAPSHMTLFTALAPSVHGVTDGFKRLPDAIPTLPEHLRDQGVVTAAFTENAWVGEQQGFARGFDVFAENKSAKIMVPEGQVDLTFAQGRRWLAQHRDARFFLFLHTYQVHEPYAPPERYAELFTEPLAPAPGRADAERLRANYDREIRFVDDELRGLLAALEELGLAETTVVVLTSDHGDEFLDHGLFSHGGHLYQEVLHVPLLLRGPGIPAGRRVATPVAQADLMPTLLALFGVAPPAHAAGRSLLPLLRDDGAEGFAARALLIESWVPYQRAARGVRRFDPPSLAVRVGARKLVRQGAGTERADELYDLAADPAERRDLLAEGAAPPADLAALLDRYVAESRARAQQLAGPAAEPREAPPLDPERAEKLRALGYLE
jgi:arylsulfatase A-like enzyme